MATDLGPPPGGSDSGPLAAEVVARLVSDGHSVALAESCTGGAVLARLTAVPGASGAVWGGTVVYTNEAKQQLLGISAELLATAGAVSDVVTQDLAVHVRELSVSTYGVAVTGWAGPDHGAEPAGTIYVAVASPSGCSARRAVYDGDRWFVQRSAVNAALTLLLEVLQEARSAC